MPLNADFDGLMYAVQHDLCLFTLADQDHQIISAVHGRTAYPDRYAGRIFC
jgi:hypothetical protein